MAWLDGIIRLLFETVHGRAQEKRQSEVVPSLRQPRDGGQVPGEGPLRKMEEAGASTFRDDRDIDGGDDIPERIRSEIKRSRELVVLLTPNSVHRPWVLLEVGAAWGCRKTMRIVPILCHVDVDTVPDMIKAKKAIHINDCEAFFGELKERVKKYHE